jgi:tripartite-type tricarboxylate transporter receptor subunit TctC
VPYRNTVQAATDLAEGRIQLMMSAYAILRPHVDSGKLKLLAITASQKAAVLPNVPTLAEAGFPEITIDGLVGLFGVRDMPPAVRERIAADVRAVLEDPAIAQRLTATGQVVNPGGPQEFTTAIEKQQAQAAEAGRILGIKAAQ